MASIELKGLHELLSTNITKANEIKSKGSDMTADEMDSLSKLTDEIKDTRLKIKALCDADSIINEAEEDLNSFAKSAPMKAYKQEGSVTLGYEQSDAYKYLTRVLDDEGDGVLNTKSLAAICTSSYKNAFIEYIAKKGKIDMMGDSARKALQEGYDNDGGFLVPYELMEILIQKKPTPTRLSGLVTTYNCSRDRLAIPKVVYNTDDLYTTGMRFAWTGEIPASATSARMTQPAFGNVEIPIYTAMGTMLATNDLIEDSIFDINTFLANKIAETRDLFMDYTILKGSGVAQPEGILINPGATDNPATATITAFTNPATGGVVSDDLMKMAYSIPEQYEDNLRWAFNKTGGMAKLRVLKDAVNGRYIFGYGMQDSGMSVGKPVELAGYPFIYSGFFDDFNSATTGTNYPAIFGDFTGYAVAQRIAVTVQVLDQVYAETNQVGIVARLRFGGKVTEPWKLKIASQSVS